MKVRQSLFSASLGLAGLLCVSSLQAATITPNILTDPDLVGIGVGTDCSLRYAVQSINNGGTDFEGGCQAVSVGSLGTDDTIVLGEGTYVLTIEGNGEDNNATGDLDLFEDTIVNGAGSGLTTIDASGIPDGDRIFDLSNDLATFTGMTLTGGDVLESGGEGGAMDIDETSVTATDLVITGNRAVNGGGFSYDGDDLDGQMVLEDSTVEGNFAEEGVQGDGGGGSCGGGIEHEDGTLAIVNSTINDNESLDGVGGGICDNGHYLFITNSTVSGNSALAEGGGIYSTGGLKGVYNVTVAFNESDIGGGLFQEFEPVAQGGPFDDPRFTTEIFNTIVALNTANSSPDCRGDYLTGGNNLIGQIGPNDACTNFANAVQDDQVGTPEAPIDPLLGPLADNGGPTQTHALLTGSPAIDRGNATACQTLDLSVFIPDDSENALVFLTLTEDQRGLTRPVAILDPATPICDIGAYELQVTEPTPTPTATPIITPTPPPFQGFLEGSGCALAGAGAASAQGFAILGLVAGFAALALRRRAR